jgi:hypothetical protein
VGGRLILDYLYVNVTPGTFSVVPRVAGGEITPEKLIALGTVARKCKRLIDHI